jgi:hypothetical protein
MAATPVGGNLDKHDEALRGLAAAWEQLPPNERSKALEVLYQAHAARFLALNSQIWTTAASMVPLSLGCFALLASVDHPSLAQVASLSVAGWLLMTTWLVIGENHRAFQDGSAAWMRSIERVWGMRDDVPSKAVAGLMVRTGMIRRARFSLWWTVTAASVLSIIFWPGGVLSQ